MKKVVLFSALLILGLLGSQLLRSAAVDSSENIFEIVHVLTLVGLSFIMIHVGNEFDIDKFSLPKYGWDYLVAMTAAALPWLLVAFYFVFVVLPPETRGLWDTWKEILLASRFAAPTSAGVLFSMLTAAGLRGTWLFKKTRVLAIFDDLDTVLLLIPLTMLIVGPAWQLLISAMIMGLLLWAAWTFLHQWEGPTTWPYMLIYSLLIVLVCEGIHAGSTLINSQVPINIEVLLPAFVLGCMLKRQKQTRPHKATRSRYHKKPAHTPEHPVNGLVSAVFIFLVGMNMPPLFANGSTANATSITAQQAMLPGSMIFVHVIAVTLLANLGKMFPALCYRKEAHWKERLAVAVGMFPRGEVGAGILLISIGYGIGGPVITIAMLSLTLNLLLTGVFIWIVKRLLASAEQSVRVPYGSNLVHESEFRRLRQ
jgi:Kef-type K+ transport system membrane component KefB